MPLVLVFMVAVLVLGLGAVELLNAAGVSIGHGTIAVEGLGLLSVVALIVLALLVRWIIPRRRPSRHAHGTADEPALSRTREPQK